MKNGQTLPESASRTDSRGGRERHVRHGDRVRRRHSQARTAAAVTLADRLGSDHGGPLSRWASPRSVAPSPMQPTVARVAVYRNQSQRDPPVGVQFRARATCSPRWSATCLPDRECSTRPPALSRRGLRNRGARTAAPEITSRSGQEGAIPGHGGASRPHARRRGARSRSHSVGHVRVSRSHHRPGSPAAPGVRCRGAAGAADARRTQRRIGAGGDGPAVITGSSIREATGTRRARFWTPRRVRGRGRRCWWPTSANSISVFGQVIGATLLLRRATLLYNRR